MDNDASTDWIKTDLGSLWDKQEDKTLLADEILAVWKGLNDTREYISGLRYNGIYSHLFHDGNRTAGQVRSLVQMIRAGEKRSLWVPLMGLYRIMQMVIALDELGAQGDKYGKHRD